MGCQRLPLPSGEQRTAPPAVPASHTSGLPVVACLAPVWEGVGRQRQDYGVSS